MIDNRAERSRSFGAIAEHYQRYRPGPPMAAVDWLLPTHVETVVDLGAGTGALSSLLVDRASEVIAVEPDQRMREVLAGELPHVRAVEGRGEAIPLAGGTVDAVIASSSWHWMEPNATLAEVARILKPSGFVAALWSGPERGSSVMSSLRALLRPDTAESQILREADAANGRNERTRLFAIPPGLPFEPPEHHVVRWVAPMTADDLVGLLGTYSRVILIPDEQRSELLDRARQALRDELTIEGDATVDIDFQCHVFRSRLSAGAGAGAGAIAT